MGWTVNKLILTNSETGRRIILGDVVKVSQVVYKTVAVYDEDAPDPTIRSGEIIGRIANGHMVKRLEYLPTEETINGLVVGFRFLSPSRASYWDEDGSVSEKSEPRKPYLLVCFWPTHKPMLVDPDGAFVADALEFHVDWRKRLPPHPDKLFWNQVMESQHGRE